MNNFKNILAFEYGLVVKSKSFLISTLIFALIGLLVVFIPNIIALFEGFGSTDETVQIAIIDDTGIFTDNLLSQHMDATFSRNFANAEELMNAVERNDYDLGIYFITASDYILVFENSLAGPIYADTVETLVRETYVLHAYGQGALSILNIEVNANLIPVGGAGFIVGHLFNTAIFFLLVFGASAISMSIVNEKTSKIVELLFTSTTPKAIVSGKVVASMLLILTRVALMLLPFIIGMVVTGSEILAFFSPEMLVTLLDPVVYVYVIVIFLLAFTSYAFLYAGLSAMVNDAQEVGNVQMFPSLLMVGGYYLGIAISGNPAWLNDAILNFVTFFPFISPLVLITRITSTGLDTVLIIAAIAANIVYTILTIMISIKIYTKYISSKGENPLKKLFGNKKLKKA